MILGKQLLAVQRLFVLAPLCLDRDWLPRIDAKPVLFVVERTEHRDKPSGEYDSILLAPPKTWPRSFAALLIWIDHHAVPNKSFAPNQCKGKGHRFEWYFSCGREKQGNHRARGYPDYRSVSHCRCIKWSTR